MPRADAQFGSGWVFVTVAKDGKLAIETRPNQDNPIMDGKRALLGNDVWEHAYYLNYQNRRADYLKAWWNTVNWSNGRRALRGGEGRHAGGVELTPTRHCEERQRRSNPFFLCHGTRWSCFAYRLAMTLRGYSAYSHTLLHHFAQRRKIRLARRGAAEHEADRCGRARDFSAAGILPGRRAARRRRRSAESA